MKLRYVVFVVVVAVFMSGCAFKTTRKPDGEKSTEMRVVPPNVVINNNNINTNGGQQSAMIRRSRVSGERCYGGRHLYFVNGSQYRYEIIGGEYEGVIVINKHTSRVHYCIMVPTNQAKIWYLNANVYSVDSWGQKIFEGTHSEEVQIRHGYGSREIYIWLGGFKHGGKPFGHGGQHIYNDDGRRYDDTQRPYRNRRR